MTDQPAPSPHPLLRPGMLVAISATVAALVFVPAIVGGWIYDDYSLIANNPFIRSFDQLPRWFTHDFWDVSAELVRFGRRMIYWRPLVTFTYALDWKIGGGSPLVFHVTNTLWQALMGALAFKVLRRWIGSDYPALVGAILFAIHPTKAESVAWIAGRTDVLCMVALLVATTGMARRLQGKKDGLPLEIVGTVAAYLTKEHAIILPVFATIEAWVALDRPAIDSWSVVKKLVRAALPQIAVAVVYFVLRSLLMPIAAKTDATPLAFGDHLQSILDSLGRFFTLTVAPRDLSIQHGLVHTANRELMHSMPYMVIGAVGLVALLVLAVYARRRLPAITLGIGFFLVTLAPTANIIYTQMWTLVAERFLYIPLFGVAFVVGALLARTAAWPQRSRRIAYAGVIAVTVVFGLLAVGRSRDYGDEDSFWRRELALHPDSREAHQYLVGHAIQDKQYYAGLAVLLDMKQNNDRFDVLMQNNLDIAVQVIELAARVVPDHDRKSLTAIDTFIATLLAPTGPTATLQLDFLMFGLATSTGTYSSELSRHKFSLLALRADLALRLGDDTRALDFANQALANCGDCATDVTQMAIVLAALHRYDESLAILDGARGRAASGPLKSARDHVEKGLAAHQRAATTTGPAQLQAQASELAALELWGRSYDVLAPYKDQIMNAPRMAEGFAELAFRAGEPAVAHDVLVGIGQASEVDRLMAEWTETMGWTKP